MEAYCMKCKEKVEVEQPREEKTSKGLRILKGNCSICKGKVAKILGK